MRPTVYFPELRLGDLAVPAHPACRPSVEQPEQAVAATTREALRAEAADQPRPIRRRRKLKSNDIKA